MMGRYSAIAMALVGVLGALGQLFPTWSGVAAAAATLVTAIVTQLAHSAEPPAKKSTPGVGS